MERVAVLGLGRMGSAIAVRLAGAGMRVTGWNRSPRNVGGVPVAASLAEAVEAADVLVLSLFDDAAVREVLGLLAALPLSGRLVADTSTVAPDVMPGAAPALEAAGAAAVDAPISGGPEMVAAGRAGMFLGGAPEDVGRLAPIAAHLAAQAPHVGPLGAGAAAKVVNNMVLCGMWQTLKEALLTGKRAGLDLETMLGFLATSPAASPALLGRLDVIRGESDRVGFPVSGVAKDTALFASVAEGLGVAAPSVAAARESFGEAEAAGFGDADLAAMLRAAYLTD
jgi:3-hydroxyisobutyrate dehydrogenase-like beta-hydroxyacid dehydrogenase